MAGRATIVSTATALPDHSATQAEVKEAFARMWKLPPRRLEAVMSVFDNAHIERRYSVLPLEEVTARRTLGRTSEEYRRHAVALGLRVAQACLARAEVPAAAVDLVISVSCTGFMIPSFDAYLAAPLGLRADVRRLPITELGCVGGAAALARAADFLAAFPESRVLVIAVELPSLTLQHEDLTQANLISSALFGDGAAAALLTGQPAPGGVSVVATRSHLFPGSLGAMGFDLGDGGLHIALSREVPELVGAGMPDVVAQVLESAGVRREEVSAFLLHPGGRKVLLALEERLRIPREETQPSWDVLRDHGNLSSAAVLFVLDEWQRKRRPAAGAHGLMAGFGPGLTAETLLLRWN